MEINRKRVARRVVSSLVAGAVALGGLAISGGSVSAKTPSTPTPNSRLYGADRYDTAVAIARDQIRTGGNPSGGLVVASGEAPYDALSGAVLTSATRPMVLVKKDSIPQSVLDFVADYKSVWAIGSPTIYILGGESAISDSVMDAIAAAATTAGDTTPPTVVRREGLDRYATAKAINDVAGITGASDTMIIVNGEDGRWADALSAGMVSAENGWPIVLTNSSGLQDSAKAAVDAYLALSGSYKKFLIIGGPAVVSGAVEEYLIGTKLVAPANIRRIGGADRYQTNQLVNSYVLTLGSATTYNGANVALASGNSPYDALVAAGWAAEKNAHIVLTPTAAIGVPGQTLAATLAAYGEVGLGTNANLYVLGGRSAVADTARASWVAVSQSSNLTSTLTCPEVGSLNAYLTLSGRVNKDSATTAVYEYEDLLGTSANVSSKPLFKVEGSEVTAVQVTDFGADLIGDVSRQTFKVSLPASSVVAGNSVSFTGIVEGVKYDADQVSAPFRSIAGSSCTVGTDTLPPLVSVRAIAGSTKHGETTLSAAAKVIITSNETISFGTTSGQASNLFSIAGARVTSPSVRFYDVSGVGTEWVFFLPSTSALPPAATSSDAIAASTTLTVLASEITDKAGLSPTLTTYAFATDAAMGPLSATAVSTSAATQTVITAGNLKFTAKADGAYDGSAGSAWSASVVNSRGLLQPSVAFDAAAKTITVTADSGYHTVADIKAAVTAQFYSNWVVSSSTGLDSALASSTLAPATCTTTATCGTTKVDLEITGGEPFAILQTNIGVTVNGVAASTITVKETNAIFTANDSVEAALSGGNRLDYGSVKTLSFTTSQVGAGAISLATTDTTDLQLKQTVAPISFTLS